MKIVEPRIPQRLNTAVELAGSLLSTEEDIDNCFFSNQLIEEFTGRQRYINSCVFENCRFVSASLLAFGFCDVIFRNCDLSNINLSESRFTRVRFIDCRMTGSNLSGGELTHTVMERVQARYLILSGSKLRHVYIRECDLAGSMNDSCKVEGMQLEETNLADSEWYYTPMKNIDLSTCDVTGIRLQGTELKGAVIDSNQAIDLVRLLGVVIKK